MVTMLTFFLIIDIIWSIIVTKWLQKGAIFQTKSYKMVTKSFEVITPNTQLITLNLLTKNLQITS